MFANTSWWNFKLSYQNPHPHPCFYVEIPSRWECSPVSSPLFHGEGQRGVQAALPIPYSGSSRAEGSKATSSELSFLSLQDLLLLLLPYNMKTTSDPKKFTCIKSQIKKFISRTTKTHGKGSFHQKDMAPLTGQQKLVGLEGEIDTSTIIVRDFNN